jgi:hypothetical protein
MQHARGFKTICFSLRYQICVVVRALFDDECLLENFLSFCRRLLLFKLFFILCQLNAFRFEEQTKKVLTAKN